MRKDRMDVYGAVALVAIALLFAINQVSIKVVNAGFQPLFAAALRSVIATAFVLVWMRWRGLSRAVVPGTAGLGLALGGLFAFEFLCIYIALDHTTVTRATVILYSMPVWLAIGAHLTIVAERLTRLKLAGLTLAFAGMAGAMIDNGSVPAGSTGTALGDGLALAGAMGWAAVALVARRGGQAGITAEMQLLWMVAVSAPLLMIGAMGFGPLLRDPGALEIGTLFFQGVVIAGFGFLAWFWLLGAYPAASVASFSFLSPIFGITLGWALLAEPVGPGILLAGLAVAAGLLLINWPRATSPHTEGADKTAGQVPQKVRRTT